MIDYPPPSKKEYWKQSFYHAFGIVDKSINYWFRIKKFKEAALSR